MGILLEMMQGRGFGQLHDQARRHALFGAHIIHEALQPDGIRRRGARDIDRQRDARLCLEHGDGGFQRETVHQVHDAHLLGGRHEMAGRKHAAVRLDHAQQAFVVGNLAVAGLDDGLIGQAQPVFLQGAHHFVADLHHAQARGFAAGRRLIGGKAVAAVGAGTVQRLLGAQHRVLAGGGGLGQPHRAHRTGGGDQAGAGFDAIGAHAATQPCRHHRDLAFPAVLEDDAELVAGDAADDVAAAQRAGKPFAHAHDHFLAGIEAEAVVDHGETVDRGHQEGAIAALILGALDRLRQLFAQRVAVEMAGQFVAGGEIGKTAHLAYAFGGFAHHADQA